MNINTVIQILIMVLVVVVEVTTCRIPEVAAMMTCPSHPLSEVEAAATVIMLLLVVADAIRLHRSIIPTTDFHLEVAAVDNGMIMVVEAILEDTAVAIMEVPETTDMEAVVMTDIMAAAIMEADLKDMEAAAAIMEAVVMTDIMAAVAIMVAVDTMAITEGRHHHHHHLHFKDVVVEEAAVVDFEVEEAVVDLEGEAVVVEVGGATILAIIDE